jgi:1,2-diacylglycerol 3-beta-galactosyltransferase
MSQRPTERPQILFLFSDTGGGHRSAAEAIIEALQLEVGDQVATKMVDFFKDYTPAPFNRVPVWYPQMVRLPQAWGLGYRLSNGNRRARFLTTTVYPYVRRNMRQLVKHHPSDLIVSVHPLANAPVLRALGKSRPPFITVVTDLVTTHALWYNRRTDLCIVPTEQAGQRAYRNGLKSHQVKIVGLPVAERFCTPLGDKIELRQQLGWPQDLPIILLVGGGDGMGPIRKTAQAIAASGMPAALAIIAGRNQALKESLEAESWPMPTFVYGFVREMPTFMRAADILVTKAGPGTITEAINAELPIILYSRLPGQEEGNVEYVVSEGVGVWAPQPNLIVSALWDWIKYPEKRQKAILACRRLARPHAAREIAQILVEHVGIEATSSV